MGDNEEAGQPCLSLDTYWVSGRCFAFIFKKGGETGKKKSKLYAKVWQKALK